MNFPMIYSGIEKHQDTFSQCEKLPIPNSDALDLVNPSGRRKTRKFIDSFFEALESNWSLQSSRSRNWMFET